MILLSACSLLIWPSKKGAPISSFERVTPNFYIRIGCSFNVPFWAFFRHDISDPRTVNMRSYFGKKLRMHDAGTKLPQTCLMSIMSELIHQVSPCNFSLSFGWPKKFFCRQRGYKYLDRHFSHLLIRSRDYPLKYQHEEPSLLAAAAGKVGSEGKEKSAKVCRKRKLNSSRV